MHRITLLFVCLAIHAVLLGKELSFQKGGVYDAIVSIQTMDKSRLLSGKKIISESEVHEFCDFKARIQVVDLERGALSQFVVTVTEVVKATSSAGKTLVRPGDAMAVNRRTMRLKKIDSRPDPEGLSRGIFTNLLYRESGLSRHGNAKKKTWHESVKIGKAFSAPCFLSWNPGGSALGDFSVFERDGLQVQSMVIESFTNDVKELKPDAPWNEVTSHGKFSLQRSKKPGDEFFFSETLASEGEMAGSVESMGEELSVSSRGFDRAQLTLLRKGGGL